MAAASQGDDDLVLGDPDGRAGVDELAEDGARLRDFEALSDTDAEEPVEAAGHQRELDIEIDAHGHGGGERIHVEEVDGVGDGVLDHHAAGVAVDEPGRGLVHLVAQQQGRLFVAEIGDGDLADLAGTVPDAQTALEDAGRAVDAPDICERDPAPRLRRLGEQAATVRAVRRRSVRKAMPMASSRARLT